MRRRARRGGVGWVRGWTVIKSQEQVQSPLCMDKTDDNKVTYELNYIKKFKR